jgi:GT2 family glycosyltransferase
MNRSEIADHLVRKLTSTKDEVVPKAHLPDRQEGLMPPPTATISIVSHGHGALLDHALRDLSRQTARNRLHVVLTLNLADEPFDSSAFPDLKISILRNATPKGFGANHNAAFTLCEDSWFLIVNPDVRVPDPYAIERMLVPFTAEQARALRPGLVAPCIMNPAGGREDAVRPNLSPWSLLGRVVGGRREALSATQTARGRPFFWIAGMFVAAWSEAFREIGGFDERFFLYCEDYDLSARMYLSGRSIIVRDDVRVIHDAQRDSHRSRRHLQWHVKSLLKVWLSAAFWRVVFLRGA